MPFFEYACDNCHHRFDQMVLRHDTPVRCPLCRGVVRKLMSTFAIGASRTGRAGLPSGAGPGMCSGC